MSTNTDPLAQLNRQWLAASRVCADCRHEQGYHTNGGSCHGGGVWQSCACVRFPDSPDYFLGQRPLRLALAAFIHGDDCTCPYSIEPDDLRRADEALAALAAAPDTAEPGLRQAAENLSDRRTLMDDGFWVSRKEMRTLDLALGRDDIGVQPAAEPGLNVARLARAMEAERPAIEKAVSTGLRYREIHDDALCARDEHGCGCLCHAARRVLARVDAAEYAALTDEAQP